MATEVFVTTDFSPIASKVQLDGILKYSGISLVLPVWFNLVWFLSEAESYISQRLEASAKTHSSL
jgi:hypothetical protein